MSLTAPTDANAVTAYIANINYLTVRATDIIPSVIIPL